jgi:hypothetical protein
MGGSKQYSCENDPGCVASARSNATPPSECPMPKGRTNPSWIVLEMTSSANPLQSVSAVVGESDAPWPRKSIAYDCQWCDKWRASGDSTCAQKPAAWTRSAGEPLPPKSRVAMLNDSLGGMSGVDIVVTLPSALDKPDAMSMTSVENSCPKSSLSSQ